MSRFFNKQQQQRNSLILGLLLSLFIYGAIALIVAQAGVVNVITKQPAEETEFEAGISYGSFNSFNVDGSVSSPIVEDKLSFRLSGSYYNRDGFTENTFLDRDIDSQSGLSTRGKLLWTPTEDLSVAFNASVDDYNDGEQPFVALDAEDPFEVEKDFDGFSNLNN